MFYFLVFLQLDQNPQKEEGEERRTRKETGVVILDQVEVEVAVGIIEEEAAVEIGIAVREIVRDYHTSNQLIILKCSF